MIMIIIGMLSFIVFFGLSFKSEVSASPGNVYVSPDQDAGWYDATHVKAIQEGIDNATIGDTVYVWDGTYNENVDVDKTVSLIGNGTMVTIIDGGGIVDTITISANWVNISRFTIRNSGSGDGGIYSLGSENTLISDNIMSSNDYGLYLADFYYGTIKNNTISDNSNYGIYFAAGLDNNNLIYNNNFSNNNFNINDGGTNIWNISKTLGTNIINGLYLGGNYWDDYAGTDNDGDGLGDTNLPYTCSGKIQNGGDYHPLVYSSECSYDMDGDGDVDVFDAALTWLHRTGEGYEYESKYDVDDDCAGDGDIDVFDAALVWLHKD